MKEGRPAYAPALTMPNRPAPRLVPGATIQHMTSATLPSASQLTMTRPDDWHLHVRDGDALKTVVPHTAPEDVADDIADAA